MVALERTPIRLPSRNTFPMLEVTRSVGRQSKAARVGFVLSRCNSVYTAFAPQHANAQVEARRGEAGGERGVRKRLKLNYAEL